jgi:hypothetical protein
MARQEAGALFRRDEIQIQWLDSAEGDERAPLLVVLFSNATSYPAAVSSGALGVTFLDLQHRPTRVSVLFCDRLKKVAGPSPAQLGRALGRAMAHEIGHSLLRKNQHSPDGLLRESIPWRRWKAPDREPFYLSPGDAVEIRLVLSAGSL